MPWNIQQRYNQSKVILKDLDQSNGFYSDHKIINFTIEKPSVWLP